MLNIFDSPYGQRMSANFSSPGFSPVQRRKVPYEQQQQRYHSPAQSSTPRYNANWGASPTTPYSPYTYKSVQHMGRRGYGSPATPSCRRGSNSSFNSPGTPTQYSSKEFDANEYVIPEMTCNPWAKLEEEYYANNTMK